MSIINTLFSKIGYEKISNVSEKQNSSDRKSKVGSVIARPVLGESPPKTSTTALLTQNKSWTYACTNVIGNEIGNMDIKLFQKKGDDVVEIETHELLDLLFRVNMFTTKFDHFKLTQTYLDLTGEAPWFLDIGADGKPENILLLRPDRLTIIFDKEKIIGGYEYLIDPLRQDKVFLEANEVIFLKNPSTIKQMRGYGTLHAMIETYNIDMFSEQWNEKFFFNSARPDLILTTDQKLPEEIKNQLRRLWNSMYQGVKNRAKLVILERGLEAKPLSMTAKDMDFVSQLNFSRDKILAIFGVPKPILGMTEDVNLANAKAAQQTFARWTIQPRMQKIIEQLNEFLVPLYGDDLFLDFTDPIPEDREQQIEERKASLGGGSWKTINEVRREEGLDEVENGDALYVPTNMIEIGKSLADEVEEAPVPEEPAVEPTEEPEEESSNYDGQRLKALNARNNAGQKNAFKKIKGEIIKKKKIVESKIHDIAEQIVKEGQEESTQEAYNPEDFRVYWTKQIEIQEKFEKEFSKKMRKEFERQEKKVLAKVKQVKSIIVQKVLPESALLDVKSEISILSAIFGPILKKVILEEGQIVVDQFGFDNAFDPLNTLVSKFVKQKTEKFSKESTIATNTKIGRTLEEGIKAGESIPKLRKRVQNTFEGFLAKDKSGFDRADVIARTETSRAMGFATEEAFRQNDVEKKTWMTALDEKVCFPANTKIKTKNGYKRIQDIKKGELVLTHRDRYRKVKKTMKRTYDGSFTRIILKGGKISRLRLSATSNHRILVNGQWKEISNIKVGDKVNFVAKKCLECNKELVPIFRKYCAKCKSIVSNRALWSDSKQHERVIRENKKFSKIAKMKKAIDKKFLDKDFKKSFSKAVSEGMKKKYKEDPVYRNYVIDRNRKNALKDDWGWKNKERQKKALKKAFIARGKNHNGKTYLEKKVEWWLKKIGIEYEPQKYFNNGQRRFWVDFFLPRYNLIIEADGNYFHNEKDDRKRDIALKEVFSGRILHWKEDDIRNDFDKCVNNFQEAIATQNCFVEVEVREIKTWGLKKPQAVYNLEVEQDKTYVANNIVVHNCPFCRSMQGKTIKVGNDYFKKGDKLVVYDEDKKRDVKMTMGYESVAHNPLHPRCYDDKTEIYTKKGWQLFKEVKKGDTVLTLNPETKDLEWSSIEKTISADEKEIYHITNKQHSFDMAVTKDHPFFIYHKELSKTVDMNSLDDDSVFYASSKWKGVDIDGIKIKINQGIYDKKGYIPQIIKDLSPQYIRIFLDARKENNSYITASKRMADDLGELIIKSGNSVSYTFEKDNIVIKESMNKYRKFSEMTVTKKEYNSKVYDVEVKDNHTILVRRNGKVVWGSNCRCTLIPAGKGVKSSGKMITVIRKKTEIKVQDTIILKKKIKETKAKLVGVNKKLKSFEGIKDNVALSQTFLDKKNKDVEAKSVAVEKLEEEKTKELEAVKSEKESLITLRKKLEKLYNNQIKDEK